MSFREEDANERTTLKQPLSGGDFRYTSGVMIFGKKLSSQELIYQWFPHELIIMTYLPPACYTVL